MGKLRDYPVKEVGFPYITSIRTILLPMYQAALTKAKTPLEALKEANARVNAFLAQQVAQGKETIGMFRLATKVLVPALCQRRVPAICDVTKILLQATIYGV